MIYQPRQISPEDFLHFVETDEFVDDWKQLGLTVGADLWELQAQIMAAPEAGKLVKGTGGLRKLRFAPAEWRQGKSGAVRVCYAYFPEHWTVLLVMAYGKGRKATITAGERAAIKKYLECIQKFLDQRRKG